jgi:hypothetical protein
MAGKSWKEGMSGETPHVNGRVILKVKCEDVDWIHLAKDSFLASFCEHSYIS